MPLRSIKRRDEIDWAELARRKYGLKKHAAETARMRAQTEAATAEKMYGHGSTAYGGLTGEELARRHPYGVPAKSAETARMTAEGYVESARGQAKTAAGKLSLEREQFETYKKYLVGAKTQSSDVISEIEGIAGGEEEGVVAKPTAGKCPKGSVWDGKKCVSSYRESLFNF
jgi:hypothetical protein